MSQIIQYIRREEWSPYVAGALLGVVGVLAVALSGSLLGASGAFENLAGLVGIFFGGMLGAWTSSTLKLRWNDDPLWQKVIGPEKWKRWTLAFGGAIVLA